MRRQDVLRIAARAALTLAAFALASCLEKDPDTDSETVEREVRCSFGQDPAGFEYFDGVRTRQLKMKSLITVSTIDAYKAAELVA